MQDSNVTQQVIEQLKEQIRSGEIRPGEKFPSERDMAKELDVSRNTIREALFYFETIGLALKKRGSGTYLVDDREALQKVLDARQILDSYNTAEMLQARRVIEIGIVKLAAVNANRDDKIAIRSALKKVEATGKNPKTEEQIKAHILADYNFHRQIAKASHNAILMELHATLKGVFLSSVNVWQSVADITDVGNPLHVKIADAIGRNDVVAASDAMEQHLRHMENLVDLSYRKQAENNAEWD